MSTPEFLPGEMRPPEIQPRVEQPIVPETAQQLGVTAPPQAAKPLVTADNQVLVQPVPTTVGPADTTPSLVIPSNVAKTQEELQKGAQGPADSAVTWLDTFWLRQIGKAVSKGWRIIFG